LTIALRVVLPQPLGPRDPSRARRDRGDTRSSTRGPPLTRSRSATSIAWSRLTPGLHRASGVGPFQERGGLREDARHERFEVAHDARVRAEAEVELIRHRDDGHTQAMALTDLGDRVPGRRRDRAPRAGGLRPRRPHRRNDRGVLAPLRLQAPAPGRLGTARHPVRQPRARRRGGAGALGVQERVRAQGPLQRRRSTRLHGSPRRRVRQRRLRRTRDVRRG
jgi:hypothetical protein